MKTFNIIKALVVLLILLLSVVFLIYLNVKRSSPDYTSYESKNTINELMLEHDDHRMRFIKDYWHILYKLDELKPGDIADSLLNRMKNELIQEYWKIDDPYIDIDVQDKEDVEHISDKLDDDGRYVLMSKGLLFKIMIDIERDIVHLQEHEIIVDKDIPKVPLKEFVNALQASDSPIDRAVWLAGESEYKELADSYEAFWFTKEFDDYDFYHTHSEVMERLKEWKILDKQKLHMVLNMPMQFAPEYYQKYPERKDELIGMLEKIVYESDDLRHVPMSRLIGLSLRLPSTTKQTIEIIEHYLAQEVASSRDREWLTETLERIREGYEQEKEHARRIRVEMERAQRAAARAGVELPDEFEDAHTIIIELISDPDQPDKVIEYMLSAANHLGFRHYRRDDKRKLELFAVINDILLSYDKREIAVGNYLSIYWWAKSPEEARDAAGRIIQKRADAGMESPELEKWLEEHPPWEPRRQ